VTIALLEAWWGVPETRLTRVEANLKADSPQVSGKTTHMPRAGSGLPTGEKALLLPAPSARHSAWQRAPQPLPQQHMETTDLLYLESLGHREARSQAGRREGPCAESSRDAETADADCGARMMERVRQSAGGATRSATPNLSTLALAPSDDKVSTAALEPLTL
jgi:hypothetical protein